MGAYEDKLMVKYATRIFPMSCLSLDTSFICLIESNLKVKLIEFWDKT